MTHTLHVLPETYAVCRLPASHPMPHELGGALLSITRTPYELSLVCESSLAPKDARIEDGWRALHLEGSIDFSDTGVFEQLLRPLAIAGIGVFALSTFDTDYILVSAARFDDAVEALQAAGYHVIL
jgi:hypothetical protein